jgi:hypothetical protein
MARDGRLWRIGRHWTPRLGGDTISGRFARRVRKITRRAEPDVDPGILEMFDESLAIGLVIVAAGLFLIFIGLPLVLAVVDIVIVLLLTLGGVAGRLFFSRPWTVEASTRGGPSHHYRVVGWRDDADLVRELERRLEHGEPLPPPRPS